VLGQKWEEYLIMRNRERVCAVLVSYGDRSKYLLRVIERLMSMDEIVKIVLVDNLMSETSRAQLEDIIIKHEIITVVDQGYNSGSAKGFGDGIRQALSFDIEYIWLLDDDNLPDMDALKQLFIQKNQTPSKDDDLIAFLSYRPDRAIFKKAIEQRDPFLMLGPVNSFLGFHLKKKLRLSKNQNRLIRSSDLISGDVAVAPYGGLCFHRSIISKIGVPDEAFFLYGDDYDFSYRITKQGGRIILVLQSMIEDLEQSFHIKKKHNRYLSTRILRTNSRIRIFYSVRNGIKFEQHFISNKAVYVANGCIHAIMTFIVLLLHPKHLWKYKYYLKGIIAAL